MTTPQYDSTNSDPNYPGYPTADGAQADPDLAQWNAAQGGYSVDPSAQHITDPTKKNTLAVVGLVLSIIAVLASLPWALTIGGLLGIPALIICIIALVKGKKYAPHNKRKGLAITGLVLSIIAILITAVILVAGLLLFKEAGFDQCQAKEGTEYSKCVEQKTDQFLQKLGK